MTPPPPNAASVAVAFDEARDVAAQLAEWAAIVVAGPEMETAAQFALGIATAASASRRVAIADLCGELTPIYALAGGEDAPGLADSFRDGLGLHEIARPVAGNASLFVLPAGEGILDEPALLSVERWTRLIGGFSEAGGLLVLVAPATSRLIPLLGTAGAGLVFTGPRRHAPGGITLIGTVGTVGTVVPPARRWRRLRAVREYAGGAAAALVSLAALLGGAAGVIAMRTSAAADVVVPLPAQRAEAAATADRAVPAATDTVLMGERLGPVDSARLSPFAVEVVAASSASNANSVLQDHINDASLPAATIAVVSVRSGPQRTSKWHKVLVGAWHDANTADSALLAMRRERVLEREGGIVVRAPYAMLLADSVSHEQARAVVNRWRTKGLAPYALTQDDGTVRVYAGAFETVAQMVTMAAIVHDSGGTPMVAFRTGRPD